MTQNKYHAVKKSIDGIMFDSTREANHYVELKMRLQAGEIRDLEMQVPYLIEVNGAKICTYYADFRYVVVKTGKTEVVDSKGMPTPVYRLKKKLVFALYGVKIVEV